MSCSSSVATVARVHGGLRRGRAAALRPLDEVAARLGGVPAVVDEAAVRPGGFGATADDATQRWRVPQPWTRPRDSRA